MEGRDASHAEDLLDQFVRSLEIFEQGLAEIDSQNWQALPSPGRRQLGLIAADVSHTSHVKHVKSSRVPLNAATTTRT